MKRTKFISLLHKNQVLPDELTNLENDAFVDRIENKKFERASNKVCREKSHGELVFRDDFIRQAYYLAKLGARDKDMAAFFGVDPAQIARWKLEDPDFNASVMEGKWMFDFKVAESLGQRAIGYDYTETENAEHLTRGGEIKILKKVTHKHMPPDITAIIFWLKNRQKELWADVNKTEISAQYQVEMAKKLDINMFSEEEQKFLKNISIKKLASSHGISNN